MAESLLLKDLEMRKFFVNYIKQDSIGSISNAFLVNADLYGITSEVKFSGNVERKLSFPLCTAALCDAEDLKYSV